MKDLDDQEDNCGYLWGQLGGAWYFVIMRMTQAMHTKDKIQKMFEKDRCNKDFWEMISESNIAYTFYVLKNNYSTQEECMREEYTKRVMLMLLGDEDEGYEEYIRQQGECDVSSSDEDED